MDGGSDNALRVQLTQHGRCYELSASGLADGRLAIEVNGSDADGAPLAVLSGSLPAADLGLLADLMELVRARRGQAAGAGSRWSSSSGSSTPRRIAAGLMSRTRNCSSSPAGRTLR